MGTPTRVRDVMTRDVVTVDRNDVAITVAELSENRRIRHLPVLDEDGLLVGVVSQRDIFHSALLKAVGYGATGREKMLEHLRVKEVMSTEVVTTTPDASLAEAASLMLQHKIGCLPVVEGDALVGILTETDFVAMVRDGR